MQRCTVVWFHNQSFPSVDSQISEGTLAMGTTHFFMASAISIFRVLRRDLSIFSLVLTTQDFVQQCCKQLRPRGGRSDRDRYMVIVYAGLPGSFCGSPLSYPCTYACRAKWPNQSGQNMQQRRCADRSNSNRC
jgi:hypothetical protein